MLLSARNQIRRLLALTGAVLAVGLLAAGNAGAAEVRVEETLWDPASTSAESLNRDLLVYTASPGESNRLVVESKGKSGEFVQLGVLDSGAPLSAGAGCTGGGAPGTPVTCTMHAPKYNEQIYCGRDCAQFKPGTGWLASMRIELGDGDNSFDGSSLSGEYPDVYPMVVHSGAGSDRIATGSGNDEVDPGAGPDEVHTGKGYDRVLATATPDGPDLYDLGGNGFDMVSYAARQVPVVADASGGGTAGESDRYEGVQFLVGGSADDRLSGVYALQGNGGEDLLTGTEGRDWIFGNDGNDTLRGMGGNDEMDGGNGDDLLEGGAGDDRVQELGQSTVGDNLSLVETTNEQTSGNDVAIGGEGNDILELGLENDVGRGEGGEDWLYGEGGRDRLYGGPGPDIVAGEAGSDQMWGGAGNDFLRAAQTAEQWYVYGSQPLDTWGDQVDCGSGKDRSAANPWDSVRDCERRSVFRAVRFGKPRRDRADGTARLPLRLTGPATLLIGGAGVVPQQVAVSEATYNSKHPLPVEIAARGSALARLRARGQVGLQVRVSLVPAEGPTRAVKTPVRLLLAR